MVIPPVGEGVEKTGTVIHWWECRLMQPFQKVIWQRIKLRKIANLFDAAIPLLGRLPEEIIADNNNS